MIRYKIFLTAITLCLSCVAVPGVWAEEGKNYAIPADALSDALKRFTRQANIFIVFDDRLVANHETPALYGAYTEEGALKAMLEGSGLISSEISKGVWVVTLDGMQPDRVKPHVVPAVEEITSNTDAIFVTASYLTPFREVGGKVLYTIGDEEIRFSGGSNVAEPIFDLPLTVASVSAANTALLYSSAGLNMVDLHGLGAERTLVLVNGRRYARTSGGVGSVFGVDMNAIPTPFVERIEVVNRAAGATLGTEAVGGAVNIVLREEVDGLMLSAEGGTSGAGDAEEYSVSALTGGSFFDDRVRITLGAVYASDASLLAQQREHLTEPSGFALNGHLSIMPGAEFLQGFGGSPVTERSAVRGGVSADSEFVFLPLWDSLVIANDGSSFEAFEGRLDQLYDWTRDFSILPEIERFSGYGAAEFELHDDHSAYIDFHFAHSDVRSQVASAPASIERGGDPQLGGAITVFSDHPFAPVGLRDAVETLAGGQVSEYLISRRFVELGPRRRDIGRRIIQMTAGVTGALGRDWRYDISYQYGQSRATDALSNSVDSSRLATALNVERCQMEAGCTPINIFAPSAITASQTDFIRAEPALRRLKIRETALRAELSAPFYAMDGLESHVNIGVEHRQIRLDDVVDSALSDGDLLGESLLPGAQGETSFTEAFASAQVPLFSKQPWAHSFEMGGAYRFVSRSKSSSFSNVSVNAAWAPVDGLEFHGHAFWGGRAPNVTELFAAGPNTYHLFMDPCAGDVQADAAAICNGGGELGVDPGFSQENNLLLGQYNGNPFLRHERIRASTFGFSLEVDKYLKAMPGSLALTASWRRRRVDDAITASGSSKVLQGCYSADQSISAVCEESPVTGVSFIRRNPQSQQIDTVEVTPLNQGFIRLSGLDVQLDYQSELPDLGWQGLDWLQNLSINAQYSYAHRYRLRGLFDQEDFRLEGLTAFPRHQLNVTASLGNESLSTYWTVRRRGAVVGNYAIDDPSGRTPAVMYFDAAVQWRTVSNIILYAGAENLLDRKLRPVAGAEPVSFYGYYDAVGRRFFGGLRAEF